ncbi:exodeoxyribonuclease V alpha subunit [Acetitomaculum ruminis DSM 5522]|uniref:ATP-dependent RecD2 DNA helicase n=1 Tax=Acetitomaculum ruminis DSM 5522 TaxID=1120918 RepID=A0A1I0YII1_9FIRM|nr:ATP-dependent RecD-like DNA helicase [Acetitomaculum ruminis]SFB13011.1 exodeoxyribonuclease V alpha subunit [Acetitomaculum ruminis DSM 5522]
MTYNNSISGYIEHIVFRNDENGYTVCKILDDNDEQSTLVGCFSYISEGEYIIAKGEYIKHQIYGDQFRMDSYEIAVPATETALLKYLGSGAVKGIGPTLAKRIVDKFKEDTLRILEEEPECLAKVKGISNRMAADISSQFCERFGLRRAMIFLGEYGISMNLATKIYDKYQDGIYKIIKENPYKIADDISGVGFRTVDEIAKKSGIKTDSDYRIRSGLIYTLSLASLDGHTCLPKTLLVSKAEEILGVLGEEIERCIMDLAIDRKVIIKTFDEDQAVFLSKYYHMEQAIASNLLALNANYDIDKKQMKKIIEYAQKESDIVLDEDQLAAVEAAFSYEVLIITGGPGTGKTTTINTIIGCFERMSLDIVLAAPTGRAAKRMNEATKKEAKTIHRMLELSGGIEDNASRENFGRNEEYPIEADVIIIDEMSMVDIPLMNAILKATAKGTRLIFTGDANQLPSVGPGSVLKDLIASKAFKVITLKKIFRQAMESDIVINAHKINESEEIVLDNKSKDFFFLKRYNADVIISVMLQLLLNKLPKYVEAEPFDIQILSPMRKGVLGVDRLNQVLQEYLNPLEDNKKQKEYNGKIFREGDKVMQIKNNYQLEWEIKGKYNIPVESGMGIFNGDMGIIKEINEFAGEMLIEFDDKKEVSYSFKNLNEIEHAYAITIHKSQGSEYPAVIIPLLNGPRMLMNRNLIYTAITRAKRCVILVGDENVFYDMVDNVSEKHRYSGLKDRITEIKSIENFN